MESGYISMILVSFYAVICSLIYEFVTKYFVTSNSQYISFNEAIKKTDEKMKKLSFYDKKREKLEKDKKDYQQKIAFIKFKPMIINLVVLVASSILVNQLFTPIKVATLPFEPWKIIKGITHRNLPGDNMTDCSLFFFYILVRMTVKPIIAKIMGNSDLNEASFLNSFAPNNEAFKSE